MKNLAQASPIDLLEQANKNPNLKEIGSKNFNSLKLKKIENDFKVPELVSIPMTLPLLFEKGADPAKIKELENLYGLLDACALEDLDGMEELSDEIQDQLCELYQNFERNGENIDSITNAV